MLVGKNLKQTHGKGFVREPMVRVLSDWWIAECGFLNMQVRV
jgi:hypothetical protein